MLLPWSTRSGHISFVDALFTSTSAVCVTGLTVQDTSVYFSSAGQSIILLLIQLGGLGIMTFSTLVLLVSGRRISVGDRIMVQEGFHPGAPRDFKTLIKNIFVFTVAIELVGFLVLAFRFQRDFPWPKALYHSLFHSISAFCNAGFSTFSNSLISYREDALVNLTIILLILLGGLGFLVIQETRSYTGGLLRKRKGQLSLHSKLVLSMTFALIILSFVLFLVLESGNTLKDFGLKERILVSLFQVVTPRTAGFNTIEISALTTGSTFFFMLLMFIGASSGSTGGGVKTSTFGVIFAFLRSKIVARETVNIFYRTLPTDVIIKAFTIISLALSLIFVAAFFLLLMEPDILIKEILFEVFSAFGTVGLSLGITAKLETLSKIVIVLTMYAGRVGPLTLLYAFSRRRALGKFEYVEEKVMIG